MQGFIHAMNTYGISEYKIYALFGQRYVETLGADFVVTNWDYQHHMGDEFLLHEDAVLGLGFHILERIYDSERWGIPLEERQESGWIQFSVNLKEDKKVRFGCSDPKFQVGRLEEVPYDYEGLGVDYN